MNKTIITIVCIIVLIVSALIGIKIFRIKDDNKSQNIVTKIAEEVLDDCTDEYEHMETESLQLVRANSQEEKVSPYCSFTIKTICKGCGHIKEEYPKLPEDLVNCNKVQVAEKYKDYKIEKFSSNEIVLLQEKDGECGEHYIVKDNNGNVTIYQKTQDGIEKMLEQTDIATDYLTETDKVEIEKGIEINGKQELNQFIENFE